MREALCSRPAGTPCRRIGRADDSTGDNRGRLAARNRGGIDIAGTGESDDSENHRKCSRPRACDRVADVVLLVQDSTDTRSTPLSCANQR